VKFVTKRNPIRAWHFLLEGHKLRDTRDAPPDGVWLSHWGTPHLCHWGLHASRDVWDALHHAPGTILCLVDCAGQVIESQDKLVCTERRIVARMETAELLAEFARIAALSLVDSWRVLNPPDVVLDWLMTGDEALRLPARSAAADAVWESHDNAAMAAYYSTRESPRQAAREVASQIRWPDHQQARNAFSRRVRDAFVDWL
jgi:hypothetical protein